MIIRTSDGTQVYPTNADRYGNFWSADGNGNLIDDRGQIPVTTTYDDANHKIYFDVLRQGGGTVRYTVTTVQVTPHTAFQEGAVNEYPNGNNAQLLNAVQSIQLPDGSQYSFEYDSTYAILTKMTLPTGGVIQYGWSNFEDSYKNKNRWLNYRYVGGNLTSKFLPQVVTVCNSNQTDCHEKVTVTDASGNDSVFDQRLNNGAWNTTFYKYAGSSYSNSPLITNQTTYDFSTACGYSCNNQGAKWIVSSANTTTLNDVGLNQTKVLNYADSTSGLISSVKTYDFYSGGLPAKPTMQTLYEYSYGIPRDVTKTTVEDGDGNVVSRETRTFTTATSQTSGIAGHASPANPNVYLGTVSQWLNTDGTEVKVSYQMDDAGNAIAASTPYTGSTATAWKTYGYDSSATFPTVVQEAPVPSGVALTAGVTHDPVLGVTLSSTDYNSKTTTYSNFDWAGRPLQANYPDGGSATYTYSATDMSTTVAVDPQRSRSTVQLFDEFGRAIRSATSSGQSATPWYQQDTCYDSNGRVQSVSQPYAGTGFDMQRQCSGTTYTYDAFGRPSTVTNADGTVQYSYTGRATSVTDVNGKQRITQVDALGRIAAVCEVSAESFVGSSPQDCGLDIAGTGYLTTYAYNLANHTTTITQGVQTRVSQTDSIGRTVHTYEPERGDTLYAYAYGANGLVVTRSRPGPNQSERDRMIDEITSYDNLGRTASVTYAWHPGNPYAGSAMDYTVAVEKQFRYDVSQDPSSFGGDNLKGRMTEATSMPNTPLTTTYRYGYDSMGRLAKRFTCLPAWCGSLSTRALNRSFHYNYAGDNVDQISNFGYSSPNNFPQGGRFMSYTVAGELDSMCCGLNDAQGRMPLFPTLYQAKNHTPYGPTAEQYGNGLYGNSYYDALGRLQGKWVCAGTTAWGCNAGDGAPHEVEGYFRFTSGDRVTRLVNHSGDRSFSYDSLGRLTASTPTGSGTPQLTWQYDRYGNRWNQHDVQNLGLPQIDVSFNPYLNQITAINNNPGLNGLSYDGAGNMAGDGRHSYGHDVDGHLRCVDNCSKASNLFDAFGRRVYSQPNPQTSFRYEYNEDGQISDVWCGDNQYECQSRYYANGEMFAYFQGNADYSQIGVHFQHEDYLGTVHSRTVNTGPTTGDPGSSREGIYYALPFGDGMGHTAGDGSPGGTDTSNAHYAGLEHDTFDIYSDAEQSLSRTYVAAQGSWLEPDPYDGSYDPTDPQSFNRYSYVSNNPMSIRDPSGMDGEGGSVWGTAGGCVGAVASGGTSIYGDVTCGLEILKSLFGLFSTPKFQGSVTPRPGTSSVWTDHSDLYVPNANLGSVSGILNATGINTGGCDFGVCSGIGGSGFDKGDISVRCRGIEFWNLGALFGVNHCDARVTDGAGILYSVSGGPIQGKLGGWAKAHPTEPFTGTERFHSTDIRLANCLVSSANSYNKSKWPKYNGVFGPNSNTFLRKNFAACGRYLGIGNMDAWFENMPK